MKYHDTKNWITGLLYFDRSDSLHILRRPLLLMAVYSSLVAVLEIEVFCIDSSSVVRNISMVNTTLGFVLSLLLVFRTNTAYDRWWEGRKLWGRITNISRNIAVKLNAILPADDTKNRAFFRKQLIFFPYLLSRHLNQDSTKWALDKDYWNTEEFDWHSNPTVALLNKMNYRLMELYRSGVIDNTQFRYIESDFSDYLELGGSCERIKNTPIPFSYSAFIKRFIVVYVCALPLSYAMTIGYFMVPLTLFVFYVLMTLEIIASQIEDPFNDGINDIPTYQISKGIQKNIEQSLFLNHKEEPAFSPDKQQDETSFMPK